MYGGNPDAFWGWSEEGQIRALAWHRVRLATAGGGGGGEPPSDVTEDVLRWGSVAPASIGDIGQVVRAAYGGRGQTTAGTMADATLRAARGD